MLSVKDRSVTNGQGGHFCNFFIEPTVLVMGGIPGGEKDANDEGAHWETFTNWDSKKYPQNVVKTMLEATIATNFFLFTRIK